MIHARRVLPHDADRSVGGTHNVNTRTQSIAFWETQTDHGASIAAESGGGPLQANALQNEEFTMCPSGYVSRGLCRREASTEGLHLSAEKQGKTRREQTEERARKTNFEKRQKDEIEIMVVRARGCTNCPPSCMS